MIVALLSNDHKLYDLCNSILAENTLDSRPLLIVSGPGAPLPHADLYIWDYVPDLYVARCLASCDPHRHILLVERSYLTAHQGSDLLGLKLVLKPVTKVALAAWLVPAVESLAESGEPPVEGQEKIISSLVEANLRLQEYELDRSSFLAKVTHDFRAPHATPDDDVTSIDDRAIDKQRPLDRQSDRSDAAILHARRRHRDVHRSERDFPDVEEPANQSVHVRPCRGEHHAGSECRHVPSASRDHDAVRRLGRQYAIALAKCSRISESRIDRRDSDRRTQLRWQRTQRSHDRHGQQVDLRERRQRIQPVL